MSVPFGGSRVRALPPPPGGPSFLRRVRTTLVVASLLLGTLLVAAHPVSATWSVIAVDRSTGKVVVASATCVSAEGLRTRGGLMSIQAIVVPGKAVAVAQAGVDGTRENQRLIYRELVSGTDPREILSLLMEDPEIQRRQFAILDLEGRSVGFSGARNGAASLALQGRVPGTEIFYAVQGNILASDDVMHEAALALVTTGGTLEDRVMAAMEAADAAGGDVRCTCETPPFPEAPCDGKTSHVAYIVFADATDPLGEDHNDGSYRLFIDVDDENIQPHENANPVRTLRMRYDAWRSGEENRTSGSGR
jgi:uncharacterized Ntn-hydrolase superfamily protein